VLRYLIFLAAVLIPCFGFAEERDSLIGKYIVLKPSAVLVKDSETVDVRFQMMPARVDDVHDDRVWLGRSWAKKADVMGPDEAIVFCDEQLKGDPKNPKLWRLRGVSWIAKEEYVKAAHDLDEAIRHDSNFAEAFVDRGHAKAAEGDYKAALEDFASAIRLDPKSPCTYCVRGFFRSVEGAFEEAVSDCDHAIELDPECADAFKLRGDLAAIQKDYGTAIKNYTEAIQHNPKYAGAYRHRAVCRTINQDLEEAFGDCEVAIQLDSQDASAYCTRGCCWFAKQDFEKAIADFSESIRLNAAGSESQMMRGMMYELHGSSKQALEDYEAVLRIDPTSLSSRLNVAFLLATCSDPEVRDGKKAIDVAMTACMSTDWKNDAAIAALAAGYAEEANWKSAIHYQTKALEIAAVEKRERRQEALQLYESHRPLRFTKQQLLRMFRLKISIELPMLGDLVQ
jgi:tetratricopeptide (TPR) repeat protein